MAGSIEVLAVGGPDDDDVAQRLHPVDLGQQLRDDGRLHVGADAGAPGAEERIHLVEEDDDGDTFLRLLPGPLEDQADLALGLAHVFVQQFRALDVEEIAADVGVPRHLGHFLGQGVGHRLGDEGLAAAGRAVEEDALGGRELVVGEEGPMEIGQLDGVHDRLDLGVEAADVGVGDVGDLFEDELLDLGSGQLLHQEAGPGLHQQGVTGPEVDAEQGGRQLDHPLLVGPGVDDGPAAVLEKLLQGDDLARVLALAGQDDVQGLVQDHFLAPAEIGGVDLGVEGDPHLAAAGEDVDGAVLVGVEEGPVGTGRLGELVHLLAQRGDVLLGLLEGVGQLLVLGDGLGQLALGLQHALFQGLDPARSLGQAATEDGDFLLGLPGPLAQVLQLPGQLPLLVGIGHRNHLPEGRSRPLFRPYTASTAKSAPGRGIYAEWPVRRSRKERVPG